MSGIHFVEAKGFKIKPLIALLQEKGPITAKAGKLVSVLPERGGPLSFPSLLRPASSTKQGRRQVPSPQFAPCAAEP